MDNYWDGQRGGSGKRLKLFRILYRRRNWLRDEASNPENLYSIAWTGNYKLKYLIVKKRIVTIPGFWNNLERGVK